MSPLNYMARGVERYPPHYTRLFLWGQVIITEKVEGLLLHFTSTISIYLYLLLGILGDRKLMEHKARESF